MHRIDLNKCSAAVSFPFVDPEAYRVELWKKAIFNCYGA